MKSFDKLSSNIITTYSFLEESEIEGIELEREGNSAYLLATKDPNRESVMKRLKSINTNPSYSKESMRKAIKSYSNNGYVF